METYGMIWNESNENKIFKKKLQQNLINIIRNFLLGEFLNMTHE
jgi:hypothetical protein